MPEASPPPALTEISIDQLVRLSRHCDASLATISAQKAAIMAEINSRTKESIAAALARKPDKSGSVTVEVDGAEFKAEAKKSVSWDDSLIAAWVRKNPKALQENKDLISVKFGVSAKAYAALVELPSDETLIDDLRAAQTVEISDPKIKSIKLPGDKD